MRPSSFCFQYRFGKRLTYVGSSEITLEVERSKAGVKRAIILLSAIAAEGKELTIITWSSPCSLKSKACFQCGPAFCQRSSFDTSLSTD